MASLYDFAILEGHERNLTALSGITIVLLTSRSAMRGMPHSQTMEAGWLLNSLPLQLETSASLREAKANKFRLGFS